MFLERSFEKKCDLKFVEQYMDIIACIIIRVTHKFLHKNQNGLSTKIKIRTLQAFWRSSKYFPWLCTISVHRSGSCSNPPLQNYCVRDPIQSSRASTRSSGVLNYRLRQNISRLRKAWKSHEKISGK